MESGYLIKTTYIVVTPRNLRITVGLLSSILISRTKIEASKINQLLVERYWTKNEYGTDVNNFKLVLELKTGAHIKIIDHLKDVESAHFFEIEIEKMLGITDKKHRREWLKV